jgi:hypothetical protein
MGGMDSTKQDPAPAATTAEAPRGAARSAPPLTRLTRPVLPPADPKVEEGGPTGPEPTRYGDWERKGRVSDF